VNVGVKIQDARVRMLKPGRADAGPVSGWRTRSKAKERGKPFSFFGMLRVTVTSPYYLIGLFLVIILLYWLLARDLYQSKRSPVLQDISLPAVEEQKADK
jgi:hypothetical protein